MRTQYIVKEHNKLKRKLFFNYIMKHYDLDLSYPFEKEVFINSDGGTSPMKSHQPIKLGGNARSIR